MKLWITGGRLLCPASGLDRAGTVEIADGQIVGLHDQVEVPAGEPVIEAKGAVVAPGFVDLHVDLGVPGAEFREGMGPGTAAAAAGGFTTVCLRPTTERPNDDPRDHLRRPARARARARQTRRRLERRTPRAAPHRDDSAGRSRRGRVR